MKLPLILDHNGGASPALVVVDLASGAHKAIPSAMDGRVVMDRPVRVAGDIVCRGWRFAADFSGDVWRDSTHMTVTRSGSWHRHADGRLELRHAGGSQFYPAELVPDGHRIWGEYNSGLLRLSLPKGGPQTYEFVASDSLAVEFRTSERILATGDQHCVVGTDDGLIVVDISTKERRTVDLPAKAAFFSLCPRGHYLALHTRNSALLAVELATGNVRNVDCHLNGAQLLWTEDGSTVLLISESEAALWDPRTGEMEVHEIARSAYAGLTLDSLQSLDDLPAVMPSARPAHRYPQSAAEATEAFNHLLAKAPEEQRASFAKQAKLSIRLIHDYNVDSVNSVAPRGSRFGGLPDTPEGFVWPSQDGIPLWFFGQVNLSELALVADFPIHKTGHLLIFSRSPDPNKGYEGAETVLIHVAEHKPLSAVTWPHDLEKIFQFQPHGMLLVPELSVEPEQTLDLEEATDTMITLPPPLHRMFGWGDYQNAFEDPPLILQIDQDNAIPLSQWGDGGMTCHVTGESGEFAPDLSNGRTLFSYSN